MGYTRNPRKIFNDAFCYDLNFYAEEYDMVELSSTVFETKVEG